MRVEKGAYILLMRNRKEIRIRVGKLGYIDLPQGLYAYVGSALGPGGVLKRVCRHIRRIKKLKWHIDYLTSNPSIEILGVIIIKTHEKLECMLARFIFENFSLLAIKKFGATDCKCESHLFLILNDIDKIVKSIQNKFNLDVFFVSSDKLAYLCTTLE